MYKKPSVTIGIPAYNEEANIGKLLKSLLEQKEVNFKLKDIIVVSDGSSDKTDEIILAFTDPRIVYIKNIKRQGQQSVQNTILNEGEGDIFIFIEGDVLPQSKTTINELVKPFARGKEEIDMVVGRALPVRPQGFFEKIQFHGHIFKQEMFRKWKNADNIYMAGGHSMKAISKDFAKLLIWPNDVPEDAFTYFRLKELGLNLVRNPRAVAYMRNTANFKDRIKQCKKFQYGKQSLEKYYSTEDVKREYSIPFTFVYRNVMKVLMENPFWISLYLIEILINRILTLGNKPFDWLYDPYYSSKNLMNANN